MRCAPVPLVRARRRSVGRHPCWEVCLCDVAREMERARSCTRQCVNGGTGNARESSGAGMSEDGILHVIETTAGSEVCRHRARRILVPDLTRPGSSQPCLSPRPQHMVQTGS